MKNETFNNNFETSLIYDFDGTLADTFDVIYGTWVNVCKTYELPIPTEGQIRAIMGVPLDQIAQKFNNNPKISIEDLVLAYKDEFRLHESKIKLFPEIVDMLNELSSLEVPMFVVSARTSESLSKILKNLRVSKYFFEILGREDVQKPKPNQEAVNTIAREYSLHYGGIYVIGDAQVDIEMGQNAGVKTIYVPWGALKPHKLEELKLKPTYKISSPMDIVKIVKSPRGLL
jgi:HAD superfamily hydrolase (TIGR01549 family)